jgi:hypothetical protein
MELAISPPPPNIDTLCMLIWGIRTEIEPVAPLKNLTVIGGSEPGPPHADKHKVAQPLYIRQVFTPYIVGCRFFVVC